MNAPAYLEFLGSAPGGNKISGKFPGPEYPDTVTVEGTTDSTPPRGNSGIWMSSNRYTTLRVNIIIKKAGQPDQIVSYDNNGMPIVNDAEANSFTAVANGGAVEFSWVTTKEISVTSYPIDRKISGGDYLEADQGVSIDFPDSRPVPKSYPNPDFGTTISDTPPAPGSYVYRLRARFENQTVPIKTLAESAVVIIV